jgi:YD repeat-containing protein
VRNNGFTQALCGILVLFCATALRSFAADNQDTARGFSPTGAAHGGDIESINLFNGNLTLQIPIAPSFPLNAGASYSIGLVYSGQPWDFVNYSTNRTGGKLLEPQPNRRSNAGVGWRVTMGRLIPVADNTSVNGTTTWEYESPDGSDHIFYPTLHPGDTPQANVYYTRDNTYLRLRDFSGDGNVNRYVDLDFPNGITHRFDVTGTLSEIINPFETAAAPSVRIIPRRPASGNSTTDCHDAGASFCYVISDMFSVSGNRTQYLTFQDDFSVYAGIRARKIILAGAKNTTLTYDFTYQNGGSTTLYTDQLNCYTRDTHTPASYSVPLLQAVTLPDGSKYAFDYYNATNGAYPQCSQGSLFTVTLPTGGTNSFTYQNYMGAVTGSTDAPYTPGVATMTKNDQLWGYSLSNGSNLPEMIVSVTRPDGSIVKNYFTASTPIGDGGTTNSTNYGLPFTPSQSSSLGGKTRYLSTEALASAGAPVSRSTYVLYEADGNLTNNKNRADDNRRVVSSLVRFNRDSDKWIATDNSDFDTFGHYRTATTTSSGFDSNPTKTATVHYTPVTSTSWLLGIFDYKSLTDGTKTFQTDTCFDASNGFLKRTRRRVSTTTPPAFGASDVVTFLNPDTAGNIDSEKTYAADMTTRDGNGSVTADVLCTGNEPSSPVVEIHHAYDKGVRTQSTYYSAGSPMPFKVVDATPDPIGVPLTDRDVSTHATNFDYDAQSRLSSATAPGSSAVAYTYANAVGTTTPARVTMTQGGKRIVYEYDIFGRIVKESRDMPPAAGSNATQTAVRTTTYDAMGRKGTVSEWDYSATPSHITAYGYDLFGRTTSTTLPDGKLITSTYTLDGIKEIKRTAAVATSGANPDANQTTTETYDAFGRLMKVQEPLGTVTTYEYDVADHLTHVCVNSGVSCQDRYFNYDGRGFLTDESHPENGKVIYSYDALGHVVYKQIGVSQSDRDLVFTYDPAERLTKVERRKSGSGTTCATLTCETLKELTYGTAADNSLGRLASTTRHNWDGTTDRTVRETYVYDAGSRLANVTTDIFTNGTLVKSITSPTTLFSYDALGEVTSIGYPTCSNCGGASSTVTQSWSNGFLTGVTGFADISHAASGMVTSVAHKDGNGSTSMTDTYAEDPNGMPRPQSVKFDAYAACSAPQITTQPSDQTASNGSATLTVAPATLRYQWYSVTNGVGTLLTNQTGASLAISGLTQTTQYYVAVYSSCGRVMSRTATVTVPSCPSITFLTSSQTITSGQSLALSVTASGDPTLHYQWYRGASGDTSTPVGMDATIYTTPALTATTQYWVRVTNGCGTPASSQTITLTVPLPKPLGFQATASMSAPNSWQVSLSWQQSVGASQYKLYRLADGQTTFSYVRDVFGVMDTDTIPAGTVRAYYVVAVDSGGGSASPPSDPDIASAAALAAVVSGAPIRFQDFDQLLGGINAVRAATGHAAITWSAIVPNGVPAPAVGEVVRAAHVKALRDALDSARAFIPNLPAIAYTNPVSGEIITASKINQLLGGMQ